MNARIAIKAALWIIAAIVSTPAASEHLWSNEADKPTGDVWPSHENPTPAPPRSTIPRKSNDLDPPVGSISLSPNDVAPQGKSAPPSEIKLDINLTIRRPHATSGTRRSHRSCR